MKDLDIGIVGLGVMGQNLALNIADKGFSVAGWDAWPDPVDRFAAKAATGRVHAFKALPELRGGAAAAAPRIIMMVKAGKPVDETIAALRPHLEKDDMLVDGGNELFPRTPSGAPRSWRPHGLSFFGMGVSGGEEGARHGPSLMPGGERAGYDEHGADPHQDRGAGR